MNDSTSCKKYNCHLSQSSWVLRISALNPISASTHLMAIFPTTLTQTLQLVQDGLEVLHEEGELCVGDVLPENGDHPALGKIYMQSETAQVKFLSLKICCNHLNKQRQTANTHSNQRKDLLQVQMEEIACQFSFDTK